ncbi:hypothetical protein [Streptomyces viridosporus]|uniref:hypothetical protein n=1 Tax=Streptomyces viridosporus TaxID=67581 RepID=UPI003F6597EB
MTNGVLTLRVPKAEEAKPHRIEITGRAGRGLRSRTDDASRPPRPGTGRAPAAWSVCRGRSRAVRR